MKRRLTALITGISALAILVAAQGAVQAATELARVNNTVITLEDFNKRYQEALKFFQFRAPSKKGMLDDVIKRELGVQEARRQGLDKDPEVIERMHTVLYQALLDKHLSKEFEKIQISNDDAKAFYARNPEIRTSHIFIAVAPNAKPEAEKDARKRIENAMNELRAGQRSFAEVAQRHSDGPAAAMGGDIDYQTRDKLDPAYFEAAMRLKPGQYTQKEVRTQFGYHIIKVTAVRSWEDADKAAVKRGLFEQRRAELFEKYMKELRAKANVKINNDLVKD